VTRQPCAASQITVKPGSPLNDRWYVLSLLPRDDLQLNLSQGHTALPDKSIGSRFRVGSEPALWGVRYAAKSVGEIVVMVDFTERIATSWLREISLRQENSQNSACEILEPMQEQMPSAKSVTFLCRGISPNDPIVLRFPVGLADRQVGGGGTLRLQTSDFRSRTDGQHEWRSNG
jgi:hypothetical protein